MVAAPRARPPETPQTDWPAPFEQEPERPPGLPTLPPYIPWPHQDAQGHGRFWPWALRHLLFTLIGAGAGTIFWSVLHWLIWGN